MHQTKSSHLRWCESILTYSLENLSRVLKSRERIDSRTGPFKPTHGAKFRVLGVDSVVPDKPFRTRFSNHLKTCEESKGSFKTHPKLYVLKKLTFLSGGQKVMSPQGRLGPGGAR